MYMYMCFLIVKGKIAGCAILGDWFTPYFDQFERWTQIPDLELCLFPFQFFYLKMIDLLIYIYI